MTMKFVIKTCYMNESFNFFQLRCEKSANFFYNPCSEIQCFFLKLKQEHCLNKFNFIIAVKSHVVSMFDIHVYISNAYTYMSSVLVLWFLFKARIFFISSSPNSKSNTWNDAKFSLIKNLGFNIVVKTQQNCSTIRLQVIGTCINAEILPGSFQ